METHIHLNKGGVRAILKSKMFWFLAIVSIIIFGIWLLRKQSPTTEVDVSHSPGSAIAVGEGATATVTTTEVINKYPSPTLNYIIKTPSYKKSDGTYYTEFTLTLNYVSGSNPSGHLVSNLMCQQIGSPSLTGSLGTLNGTFSSIERTVGCTTTDPQQDTGNLFWYTAE